MMNRVLITLCKAIYKPLIWRSAHQILKGRLLDLDEPKKGRWLDSDIREYLNQTWIRCDALMPVAALER
ncbi:MAG TPA: hypothetical protein VJ180_02380, partial [Pyrinomonadaceae bacterium]|nr:hypothetical protein [Pyrinomonadaceae bacterium]